MEYSRRLWVASERLAAHGLMSICVASDADCLAATAHYVTPATSRSELSLARTA